MQPLPVWHSPVISAQAPHIESHIALRGIAAAVVVWGHCAAVSGSDVAGVDFFVLHTHLGVDLFLCSVGYY